jgi:hypothetical protein
MMVSYENSSEPSFDFLTSWTTLSLQNYWVFGLFSSSGIVENTTFRELDLFPSSGEGGEEDTYSAGPLRKS